MILASLLAHEARLDELLMQDCIQDVCAIMLMGLHCRHCHKSWAGVSTCFISCLTLPQVLTGSKYWARPKAISAQADHEGVLGEGRWLLCLRTRISSPTQLMMLTMCNGYPCHKYVTTQASLQASARTLDTDCILSSTVACKWPSLSGLAMCRYR